LVIYAESWTDERTEVLGYCPGCTRDSFDTRATAEGLGLGGDRRHDYWGCPKQCRFYRATWWAKPLRRIGRALGMAFAWFDRQTPTVKAAAFVAFAAVLVAAIWGVDAAIRLGTWLVEQTKPFR
jgi:hypothetical protein